MKRIAILFHENARGRDPRDYAIHSLASFWEEDGHRVTLLYGVKKFVSADVVIVHVDLSVVPQEYLDFAARYPAALNGRVGDVRKSSFSANLVDAANPYAGPVIVKSNLNYAGIPERLIAASRPRPNYYSSALSFSSSSPGASAQQCASRSSNCGRTDR